MNKLLKTMCKKKAYHGKSKIVLWLGIGLIALYLILLIGLEFGNFEDWVSVGSVLFGVFFLFFGIACLVVYVIVYLLSYRKCKIGVEKKRANV